MDLVEVSSNIKKKKKRDQEYKLDYNEISMKRISCFVFPYSQQTKQELELKHSIFPFHFYICFVGKKIPGRIYIYSMLMFWNNEVKRQTEV